MKRFLLGLVAVVTILTLDTACRPDVITQFKTDTLVVQLPGKRDTIVVTRPDTVVVTHAETSYVQLPGRVDTLIRTDTLVIPPRVDTLIVPRVDTLVVVRPETTVVVRPETLIVVTHDTVIVHDTVTRVDTVRLSREPAHICIQLPKSDTLFFLTAADTMCNGAHMTQYYPGYSVYVDIIPQAQLYRGTLLLPGYMRSGR